MNGKHNRECRKVNEKDKCLYKSEVWWWRKLNCLACFVAKLPLNIMSVELIAASTSLLVRTSPKIVDPKNLSFLILRNLVSFSKKTVLAVLDRLVSPHWPYLPEKFEEPHLGQTSGRFKRASSSVPDDPLNYYFWYHLLEADEHGIQPMIDEHKNIMFNAKSTSCLQRIAEGRDKVQ